MKNYAKINDEGCILSMPSPNYISNPSAATLASLAEDQGYKEVIFTDAPSAYHSRSYLEDADHILCVWTAPILDALKARKKHEAQRAKEQSLKATAILEVVGVGDVLYDSKTQLNIMGLLVMGMGVTAPINFALADDSVVELNSAQLQSIALACESHKTAIDEIKRQAFALIESAKTTEDLLS